jgi:hypothetical protein
MKTTHPQFRVRINGSSSGMFCHGAGARPTADVARAPSCTLGIAPGAEYLQRQVSGLRTEHCPGCARAFFNEVLES